MIVLAAPAHAPALRRNQTELGRMFWRGSQTRSTLPNLSKAHAQAHGGSIEVETQPGEFTEIRVILPRLAALFPERS
jgi:signal transduction histidine kinase